jgi:hypothetical protein
MERAEIRSKELDLKLLPELYRAYDELTDELDLARGIGDHHEVARLLLDKQLVGQVIDRRLDELFGPRSAGRRTAYGG